MNDEQTRPIAELIALMPADEQSGWFAAVSAIDSMNWDYHDTKANPTMSLEDHIGYSNLSDADADFVRKHVSGMGMLGREMADAGIPHWALKELGVIDWQGILQEEHQEWSMAQIQVGERRVVCFIPCLWFVDLTAPETVYKG